MAAALANTLEADSICGFGPSIGLGIFIVTLDESPDICFQLLS